MMENNKKRTRDDFEKCFYSGLERSDFSDSELWCDTTQSSQESFPAGCFLEMTNTNGLNDTYRVKREQRSRIHTEAHQRTVAMMMEAAKHLQFQQIERVQSERVIEDDGGDGDVESGYVQKPYW